MDDLIKKLESAECGSRELDARIALVINFQPDLRFEGLSKRNWDQQNPGRLEDLANWFAVPWWSRSLDAARTLSNWIVLHASDIGADGLALVEMGDPSQSPSLKVSGIHSRLEMAWCIAALKARQANDQSS